MILSIAVLVSVLATQSNQLLLNLLLANISAACPYSLPQLVIYLERDLFGVPGLIQA